MPGSSALELRETEKELSGTDPMRGGRQKREREKWGHSETTEQIKTNKTISVNYPCSPRMGPNKKRVWDGTVEDLKMDQRHLNAPTEGLVWGEQKFIFSLMVLNFLM